MDITVYLPEELGRKAKEAELPFSQLLRGAVEDELARQEAIVSTLQEEKTYEVTIETDEGKAVTGRITGKCIAENRDGSVTAYLTADERVLIHDEQRSEYHDVSHDPVAAFEGWFKERDEDAYVDAMEAIGEKPIIDL